MKETELVETAKLTVETESMAGAGLMMGVQS